MLEKSALYWLDKSKLDAQCGGLFSTHSPRAVLPYKGCLFDMKLNLDTALMKPGLRPKVPKSVFWCATLSSRCLHCDITKRIMSKGDSSLMQILSSKETGNGTCRAHECPRPAWQGVGIYCDMHYMLIQKSSLKKTISK